MPISDKLRTRTTASWGDFDGYIDNISDTKAGGDLNGYDRWGVRSIWVADPTDNVEAHVHRRLPQVRRQLLRRGHRRGARPAAQAAALGSRCSRAPTSKGDESRKVKPEPRDELRPTKHGASRLQADIGIGDYTLTSITAYRTWDSTEIREGDWLDAGPAYVGITLVQQHDYGPQTQDTFSQELRIASPGGEFVDYVAGLYYAKTERRPLLPARHAGLPRRARCRPTRPACSPARRPPPPSSTPSANADFGADFDNFAAFADGTFNVADRWRLIAGVRWTHDDLSFDHLYNFSPIAGPGIRTPRRAAARPGD